MKFLKITSPLPDPKPLYGHQAAAVADDGLGRALWWDMGTGKTRATLELIARLAREGRITKAVVVAPPGVNTNWHRDEIPRFLCHPHAAFAWSTHQRRNKSFRAEWEQFLAYPGLRVLTVSSGALMTNDSAGEVKDFMDSVGETMLVVDEASMIKTPGAKITKRVRAAGNHARYRRILNGTPGVDSPFEVYTQVKFADPWYWERALGIRDFAGFKTYFADWKKSYGNGREYDELVSYKNLPQIRTALESVGTIVRKSEVLELPEKIFMRRYFELSQEQRRVYNELRDEFMTELAGDLITAELAIVRMTRLQQITSGFLPGEDGEELRPLGDAYPRISALEDTIAELPAAAQAIIWSKYNIDVDSICTLLTKLGKTYVRYDGRCSEELKTAAREAFQAGRAQFFVSKPSAAGRGLTLTAATFVIYYNCSYSLDQRLQSEDRAHRIGQTRSVTYVDLVARGTIDETILDRLVEKREALRESSGADFTSWLQEAILLESCEMRSSA